MAKAKKLPSGSWRCQVYDYTDDNGKRHYRSFTATSRKQAEYMAADFMFRKKDHKPYGNTFEIELDNYICLKTPVLSPSTIRGYRVIQRMLREDFAWFCKLNISKITQTDVQKVINTLAKDRTPKTIRNYHGLIASVIGPHLHLTTSLPQRIQPVLSIPSDDDIRLLLAAVEDTELEIPVLLAAFCLMRRGEICGLSMDDIQGNVIHVHHSLVAGEDKQLHLKAPKTDSSDRYVEAPDFVINRIRKAGHITTLQPHSITIMFERVLRKNNIPHFRFHDLRHYSASIRHALGIPDAYIMKDGGWKTDIVLKTVYRHAMDDKRKEMSEKVNGHFDSLYNTKCNTKKEKP